MLKGQLINFIADSDRAAILIFWYRHNYIQTKLIPSACHMHE